MPLQQNFLNFKNKLLNLVPPGARPFVLPGVLLFFVCVISLASEIGRTPKETMPQQIVQSLDTYIPKGFVLVPIEVQNQAALNAIFNDHGIVDLYVPDPKNPKSGIRVAQKVKMLRAPLNPDQFAVLVPDEMAPDLVKYEGAYTVMVQNPREKQQPFIRARRHRSRLTLEMSQ